MVSFEVEPDTAKATDAVPAAVVRGRCEVSTLAQVSEAVNASVLKATQMLRENVSDESMYFMFEWLPQNKILTVVVTDETKTKDAPLVLVCELTLVEEAASCPSEELAEQVQYWIRDYLTTSSEFYGVSLVAVFQTGDRSKTVLL